MILWLIGLAGSGKTTIGQQVHASLKQRNTASVLLDGDHFRAIMGGDLGHSLEDRQRNGHRMAKLCAFLDAQGIDVVCCILSTFPEQRQFCRDTFGHYVEVFIDVPMDELIRRDQKGLYSGALAGKIKNVVGIDLPFQAPTSSDLIVDNGQPRADFAPIVSDILAVIENTRPV
jgi:adenylylsulfate kinase-like enzyme